MLASALPICKIFTCHSDKREECCYQSHRFGQKKQLYGKKCVVPENIHTLPPPAPQRVFSSLSPHPTGFFVPDGLTLLPIPPGISMIFSTWSPIPLGNSKSKKRELICFDLLRAVTKMEILDVITNAEKCSD